MSKTKSVDDKMSSVNESKPCNIYNMTEVTNSSISQGENEIKTDFYKVLKTCINDPDSSYKDKVSALSKAWETFSTCSNQYSEVIPHLYNDTLMIVLQFEWGKLRKASKNHLKTTLQNAASKLISSNLHAYNLCQRSLRVVNNPWNYPIVTKITNGTSISESEGRDFFLTEMPVLMNIRLDRICWDDKCKDLALKLVAFYRKCFQDSKNVLESICSVACQHLWLDLHVTLLYICNEKEHEVISMLEKHFSEGLDLVKRLVTRASQSHSQNKRSSGINRIWREHGMEIAEFVSQWLLGTAFIRCPPPKCLASLTIQFVNLQKKLCKSSPDIIKNLHALLDKDQLKKLMTSTHMYIFCTALFDKFGEDFRSFCIEYYVKAVIVDLNYLEKQKWDPQKDGVKSDEIGLAPIFSKLAELVMADIRICKEMALAAFSLHPTKERFDKLVELSAVRQAVKEKSTVKREAAKSTGIGEEKLESPITASQDEEKKSPYTDLAAATLGLSEGIIQELGVIVDGVRWEVLTWTIGWEQLEPLCRRYLDDQETMRSVTSELNYLKIDYSQFKDMPKPKRDVYWGIEKGYENCLEQQTVEVHKRKKPSWKTDPRRSKSNKSSRKNSRNSQSDRRSKRKEVMKNKTWMRRTTLALKSSSESDNSIDLNQSKTSSEASAVPDGVKRSARIQASKRTSAELPRDSDSLVKRLREIRLDFNNTNKWQDLSPKTMTTQYRQPPHCSSLSYRPVANHFAPMLSTLNMQPRVVLVRTTINSTTDLIKKPNRSEKMFPEASGNCDPWLVLENIKEEYLDVDQTTSNVTDFMSKAEANPIPVVQTGSLVLQNQRRNVQISRGSENGYIVCENRELGEDNTFSVSSDLFTADCRLPEDTGADTDPDRMVSIPLLGIFPDSDQSGWASRAVLRPDLAVETSNVSHTQKINEKV